MCPVLTEKKIPKGSQKRDKCSKDSREIREGEVKNKET
jgi:hypothetical protein